jgi:hypothetical protein
MLEMWNIYQGKSQAVIRASPVIRGGLEVVAGRTMGAGLPRSSGFASHHSAQGMEL